MLAEMALKTKTTTANSTFAIGGVSCSADSLVLVESSVLRINICAEKPAHRKSAKRKQQLYDRTSCPLPDNKKHCSDN